VLCQSLPSLSVRFDYLCWTAKLGANVMQTIGNDFEWKLYWKAVEKLDKGELVSVSKSVVLPPT